MSNSNPRFRLFLAGAAIVTAASILAASIEGLAYVTHWALLFGSTSSHIEYYTLTLGFHPNTWVFAVCGFGGALGLLYSATKKQSFLVFASLSITSLGLLLPLYIERIIIPESQYFDLPWIGSYIILAGLSLMFLGLAATKWMRRIALPLAILIAAYAVYPVLILTNFLPYIATEPVIPVYPIVWVCTLASASALLVLVALAYKKNAFQWVKEKENKKEKV